MNFMDFVFININRNEIKNNLIIYEEDKKEFT